MSLLHPKHESPRSRRPLPPYRTLSCPSYGHRITWCRMLCTPTAGKGACGRPAPHAMVGRTQAAIAAFKAAHPAE